MKPALTFWQIWNMSFGFLGIQFGFAIQNANTSRIFSTLGAEESQLPILWLAAPMTGLLVQPIVGYLSDRTWHPTFGRRRPYFAIGAILASLALIVMPNSSSLWMAACMLWVMDASINISMEPFRAFVGDMLPAHQRTAGFAMQSFFIGTGAVIGSYLPQIFTRLGFSNIPGADGGLQPNVVASYYTGAVIFFLAVMWTVFSSKEYPPEMISTEEDLVDSGKEKTTSAKTFLLIGLMLLLMAGGLALLIYHKIKIVVLFKTYTLEKELYVLSGVFGLFGICYTIAAISLRENHSKRSGFIQMVLDFHYMPKTMKQLAVVQFLTWFALFSMWIYTTSVVTGHIFKVTDAKSAAFNEAADWVPLLFAVYNGVAAVTAWFLPAIAKQTNRRITHLLALCLGGTGLISMYFIQDPNLLIFSMIGVGIAWSSILSMPYAMLSSALPGHKMGYYMGIFNFFIVIPQIVAASILGFMVTRFFDGQSIYALVTGGCAMILAGLLSLLVDDKDEAVIKATRD